MYTVYYRKADGQGTKVFLSRLNRAAAEAAQEHHFSTQPSVTMCWVLDENDHMLGDCLTREPPDGDGRAKNLGADDAEFGMTP